MAQKSILLTALASCLLVCGPLSAQENDGFDLSSQRSESQHVLMVPGQKLDHKGLIINPTPHSLTLDPDGTLDFSGGIRLTEKQGKFAEEIGRILPTGQKGVKLTTDFGPEAAAEAGVKAVSGAYALNIGKKESPSPDTTSGAFSMESRPCGRSPKARLSGRTEDGACPTWRSTTIPTCRCAAWSKGFTARPGPTQCGSRSSTSTAGSR